MRELLIATANEMKLEEIKHGIEDIPFTLLTLKDVGLETLLIEEPGNTYEGNAIIKAFVFGKRSGKLTLADDAGIEVDALDGAPGVRSDRYAPTSEERNKKLLAALANVPDEKRTARFRVVLAIYDPETDKIRVCEGVLEGKVVREPRGERRFGYNPIFYIPEIGKTYAELTVEEKNRISHRGKALAKARDILVAEFA